MDICETKSVLLTQSGTSLLCLCAGMCVGTYDQTNLMAPTIPQHPPKISKPPLAPSPQSRILSWRWRPVSLQACVQGHECALRVATSSPHAPRGTKATHATASHRPCARGIAPGKARYLTHVTLPMSTTTENSYLWPNGSTTHSNSSKLFTTSFWVRAPL